VLIAITHGGTELTRPSLTYDFSKKSNGKPLMKKIITLATAMTIVLSSAAWAQSTGGGAAGQGAGSASGDSNSAGSPESNNPTSNKEAH
jgi:hypothetical protein